MIYLLNKGDFRSKNVSLPEGVSFEGVESERLSSLRKHHELTGSRRAAEILEETA